MRLALVASVIACALTGLQAKVERTTVYMFGFSASFTDSLAYITDIQKMDTAYVESKGGILLDRVVYSEQMQTYLENAAGSADRMCVVIYDTKMDKLRGEFDKLKKRYSKDNGIVLRELSSENFKFQPLGYDPTTLVTTVVEEGPDSVKAVQKPADNPKGRKPRRRS